MRKGNPGLRTSKIQNKIALRCVQNADMEFSQCFVPDSARLPGVSNFNDTNKVSACVRSGEVGWGEVGVRAWAPGVRGQPYLSSATQRPNPTSPPRFVPHLSPPPRSVIGTRTPTSAVYFATRLCTNPCNPRPPLPPPRHPPPARSWPSAASWWRGSRWASARACTTWQCATAASASSLAARWAASSWCRSAWRAWAEPYRCERACMCGVSELV